MTALVAVASVLVTVAAIPVAMPTVLSVAIAVGAHLLAKKQALVSRLVAIEELAGVDVMFTDKTGTLTQNKLTLGDPFCVDDASAGQVIPCGALASRADDNDTIDLAVLGGLPDDESLKGYDIGSFKPFDPVLTGVSAGGRQLTIDAGQVNREMVLGNDVVFGSVNANRRHYERAAEALARVDRSWLERLITRRVPVERWSEALTRRADDVKPIIEFAEGN